MNDDFVSVNRIIENLQRILPQFIKWNPEEIIEWAYEGLRLIGGKNTSKYATVIIEFTGTECNVPSQITDIIQIRYNNIQLVRVNSLNTNTLYVYMRNGNRLIFDNSYGKIECDIGYIMTDENGYPMIPDKIYYTKAIESYLIERLFYKYNIQDLISNDKYERARYEWQHYCGSAKCGSLIPRQDEIYRVASNILAPFGKINRGFNFDKQDIPTVELKDLNDLIKPLSPNAGIS